MLLRALSETLSAQWIVWQCCRLWLSWFNWNHAYFKQQLMTNSTNPWAKDKPDMEHVTLMATQMTAKCRNARKPNHPKHQICAAFPHRVWTEQSKTLSRDEMWAPKPLHFKQLSHGCRRPPVVAWPCQSSSCPCPACQLMLATAPPSRASTENDCDFLLTINHRV